MGLTQRWHSDGEPTGVVREGRLSAKRRKGAFPSRPRQYLTLANAQEKRKLLHGFVDAIGADKERAGLWYTFPLVTGCLEGCPRATCL